MESIFKMYECVAGILWKSSYLWIVNVYSQVFSFLELFLRQCGMFGWGSSHLRTIHFLLIFLTIADFRK